MIRNPTTIILPGLILLLLLPVVFGCREEGTFPLPPPESPEIARGLIDDMIADQIRQELAEIGLTPSSDDKTAAIVPKFRSAGTTIREEIDETLQRAKKITDPYERELAYIDLVKRLTLFKEYGEAAAVVRFIRNVDEKDSLLEDITRIRMSDVLQEFLIVHQISSRNVENIQGALESARLIHDPLRRAKSLGNIAFLRANMNDQDGSRETVGETVEVLQELPNDDPQKALGLCQLARLLLRLEANDDAKNLCRKAEFLSASVDSVEDRGRILATLAEIFVSLRDLPAAKAACLKGFALVEQIEAPKKKLSLLLDLIESFLLIPFAETPEEQLTDARQIVLDAAMVIPPDLTDRTETSTESPNFIPVDGEGLLLPTTDVAVLSWTKLKAKKNGTLRTIAVMQAWQAPLTDVWETVQDIDDPAVRNEAIVETIAMMIAIRAWEDAAGWSDEISDPELKRSVQRKIKNAMTEGM